MPLSGERNYVSSFSQSPLIGSLSNLQVTRTGIKAQMSLNLGRIGLRLFTLELFALECRFFSETVVVYDLKLATDDRSDKKFLLTSKLCPLGLNICIKSRKKLYEIRLQRDFFETCNKWVK